MNSSIKFGNYFAKKWSSLSDNKKKEIAQLLELSVNQVDKIVKQILFQ